SDLTTRAPSVDTVTTSGNAAVGGTLTVTGASTQAAVTASGLITANAGVTLASNQNITLSGTGYIKHGARELVVPGWAFAHVTEAEKADRTDGLRYRTALGTETRVRAPLVLPVGTRVTSVVWKASHGAAVSHAYRTGSYPADGSGSPASIESDSSSSSGAVTVTNNSTAFTITTNVAYYLEWTAEVSGAFAQSVLYSATVNYITP